MSCNESAAEYGRHEGCFVDHQLGPFSAKHLLARECNDEAQTESLLISAADLRPANLPQPRICYDVWDDADDTSHIYLTESPTVDLPLLWNPLSTCQELKLPCNEIDLGTDSVRDTEILKRDLEFWTHIDISKAWLPFCGTKPGSDGGLSFPSSSERLRQLLIRELDRETIVDTGTHWGVLEDLQATHRDAVPDPDLSQPHCFRSQQITPPLSPVSECASFFVPEQQVCVIDLTSEPDSLPDVLRTRIALEAYDDIEGPAKISSPLPYKEISTTKQISHVGHEEEQMRLEVPLLSDASDDPLPVNMSSLCSPRSSSHDDWAQSFRLSDATFSESLERSRVSVRHVAKNESLDITGCTIRLSVPAMDFDIPVEEWRAHASDPEEQFSHLRDSLPDPFHLPLVRSCDIFDATLRWCPVPKNAVQVSATDSPIRLDSKAEYLLMMHAPKKAQHLEQIAPLGNMNCFHVSDDDERDLSSEGSSGMAPETLAPYTESRFFVSSSDRPDQPGGSDSPEDSSSFVPPAQCSIPEVQILTESEVQCAPTSSLSLLIKRRKRQDVVTKSSPEDDNNANPVDLLGNFMQLRGQKRQCLEHRVFTHSGRETAKPGPMLLIGQCKVPRLTINLPKDPARFVTSLKLGRVLLKRLDAQWPRDLLIDRDYDRHKTTSWTSRSAELLISTPASCQDADIALTPQVGVIVTTLSKAVQQPLPASNMLSPLRQHLTIVCTKYDNVIVLVSENNAAGEYSSPLTPSDAAAYADLVRFTTNMSCPCSCTFVPGASETLGDWILSLMCSYSPRALAYKDLLSPLELSWEVFLRRAGMNVFAAMVISTKLTQYNDGGLSQFLAMTTHQKLVEFGELVGRRGLVKLSQALDRRWR